MVNNKIAIAYVPVLHRGYINYFNELVKSGVSALYIVSDEVLSAHAELDYLHRKDRIRAVPQDLMCKVLREVLPFEVNLLERASIQKLQDEHVSIVTPKEDIGRVIIEKYFSAHDVVFSDVFLRRNEENVKKDIEPEIAHVMSASTFQKEVLRNMRVEADKSTDWWRHVGAALVKDGELLGVAHNEHMPEVQLPNILGDTRALFKKGIDINIVTTAHAEIGVIADAARRGIVTEGAELYVTDYPCPYCARMIAKSGIRKLYFCNGYAVLEKDDLFEARGIAVVKIEG